MEHTLTFRKRQRLPLISEMSEMLLLVKITLYDQTYPDAFDFIRFDKYLVKYVRIGYETANI